MSQAPQLSPDGRFYLDGDHWLPMPGVPAKPSPRRLAGALIVIGAAVVVIAVFVPWLEATAAFVGTVSRSLSALSDDGNVVTGAGVIGGLLGLVLLVRGPSRALGITALLIALATLGIVIYDYTLVNDRVAHIPSEIIANVGPGPYFAVLGVVVWGIGALVALFAPATPEITVPEIPAPAVRPMSPL